MIHLLTAILWVDGRISNGELALLYLGGFALCFVLAAISASLE